MKMWFGITKNDIVLFYLLVIYVSNEVVMVFYHNAKRMNVLLLSHVKTMEQMFHDH